jgi:hypothetical protein
MASLFTDGEPLDVSKLNTLVTEINDLKATLAIITNSVNNNNKNRIPAIPIVQTGHIVINMEAGTTSQPLSGYTPELFEGNAPKVVACPRSNLKSKQYVSVSVTNITTTPQIVVTSNDKLTNFRVDWIAVYIKQ